MIKAACGSVLGKYHLGIGRNNQDAVFARVYDDNKFIGIVCDGCGSCETSEVGANIGGEFALSIIKDLFLSEPISDQIDMGKFYVAKRLITLQLTDLAYKTENGVLGGIRDYLLFTIVGVLCDGKNVCVFSIGDGFYAVNGEVQQIGPYEFNAPPYIAYNAIPDHVSKDMPADYIDFKIHKILPLAELKSVMVATDGVEDLIAAAEKNVPGKKELVGPVSQFWTEELYFNNSSALNRRLNLINKEFSRVKDGWLQYEKGHLKDDTTLIVFRKFEE